MKSHIIQIIPLEACMKRAINTGLSEANQKISIGTEIIRMKLDSITLKELSQKQGVFGCSDLVKGFKDFCNSERRGWREGEGCEFIRLVNLLSIFRPYRPEFFSRLIFTTT